MNGANYKWLNLLYKTVYEEHKTEGDNERNAGINYDVNEFLLNSLLSRYEHFDISEFKISKSCKLTPDERRKVFDATKFIKYESQPTTTLEGEIYQKKLPEGTLGQDYLIDITAPCDLRLKLMSLLKGEIVGKYDPKAKISEEDKRFVIVPCLADQVAIKFDLRSLKCKDKKSSSLGKITFGDKNNKQEYERIGRLTHPYITQIRQAYANFISRQGVPRHPKIIP